MREHKRRSIESFLFIAYLVPRDVDVEPDAVSGADVIVVGVGGPREECAVIVAVEGNEKHSGVRFERVLSAVSVVDIPVHNENSKKKRKKTR